MNVKNIMIWYNFARAVCLLNNLNCLIRWIRHKARSYAYYTVNICLFEELLLYLQIILSLSLIMRIIYDNAVKQ